MEASLFPLLSPSFSSICLYVSSTYHADFIEKGLKQKKHGYNWFFFVDTMTQSIARPNAFPRQLYI